MQNKEFDYIIVGAGSAGCVMANRLSAGGRHSVCVIEAGGSDNSARVQIPAGILSLYGSPTFDYGYKGVPQPELNNRCLPVNRGKALGGSSAINSMIYIRGAASDYDEWAELGCEGWGWGDVGRCAGAGAGQAGSAPARRGRAGGSERCAPDGSV